MKTTLEDLREKISAIDLQLLELLDDRSALLKDILAVKVKSTHKEAVAVFDPKREVSIVRRLVTKNRSVLPDGAIEAVFEAVMRACRQVQIDQSDLVAPFSISIQGDIGSYSEQACLLYCQRKAVKNHLINYAISSECVLHQVQSHASPYGLVALNNARGGLVKETIDALSCSRYLIVDSIVLVVQHALMARPGTAPEAINSHPQALKQCRDYLLKRYPSAILEPWKDTALAAKDLAAGIIPAHAAVIAHHDCGPAHGLVALDVNIQDLGDDNETLFLLIAGTHDG